MSNLDTGARLVTRAAAAIEAERQRDGGPRPAELRQIGGDLYDAAADLIAAAYDIDADRARAGRDRL